MKFSSLRQRFTWLLILPTTVLLFGVGLAGFLHLRQTLQDQWRETAVFSLERAAHAIEMRLERPQNLIQALGSPKGDDSLGISQWEVPLRNLPGVERVSLRKLQDPSPDRHMAGMGMHRARSGRAQTARGNGQDGRRLVSLVFELPGKTGDVPWLLELDMRLDFFLEDLQSLAWWRNYRVLLVDEDGLILAEQGSSRTRHPRLGETGDPLEVATSQAMHNEKTGTLLEVNNPANEVSGFYRLHDAPWTLVLFSPASTVLAPVEEFLIHYALAGMVCLALLILLMRLATGSVTRDLQGVSQAASQVARGQYVHVPLPPSQDEINHLAKSFNEMVEGLKERDHVRDTFGRYVDEEVALRLMARPEATLLGGERRPVAIMMTDIRGFTAICDALTPEQTIDLVNRYFSRVIDPVLQYKGIIVDFLGDSCLVFFDSLDSSQEEAVRRCLCCAQAVRQSVDEFNSQLRQGGLPELLTGIGVHTGEVVVGNIGSSTRTKYGIVGGDVNLTHRIQSLAEGGEILLSQTVYDLVSQDIRISRSFAASLKGLDAEVNLYSLTEAPPGCTPSS
ncbi:MAG: HAMP domain-containing protein [Desulfarculus sp.]|nr:HAMP domain-containing protein [Desulfarculus sp.]